MHSITVRGEELLLLPEKAMLWKDKRTLLLSDLHLGKSGHFRKAGVPLPSNIHEQDLQRLTSIITLHDVKKIYLLGDLFHSSHNSEWKQFERWRAKHAAIDMVLVKGNHDLYDDERMKQHGIEKVSKSVRIHPFFLIHSRQDEPDSFSISGHIHPAIRLTGKGRQTMRLPCFWFGENFCVLPSFGNFTGSATIQPQDGDRIYMVMQDKIIPVAV